jgi:(p)ppGpp synthase/HD superfamily hydrolase
MQENNLLKYFTMEELLIISRDMDFVNQARVIVTRLFENKKDKAGQPYIGHLIRVSEKLDSPIEKAAALLHDTVEDTDVTFEDLFVIGIPLEVIEIVMLVTHDKIDKSNMTKSKKLELYNRDIDRVINSGNIHAIRLKEADMSDNYDPERIKELPQDKQQWFHEKYGKQLLKLRKVKGEMNI